MRTATMRDVAERAGVSLKTVSRFVNDPNSVRANTRRQVTRAIEQLDYRPNITARSLRGTSAYAVGLVYDSPNADCILAMQRGALRACHESGYGLQIYPCASHDPALAQDLYNVSQRLRLAGFVLTTPVSEQMPLLRKLSDLGIPTVRIFSAAEDPRDEFPCVFVDDRGAAYAITADLIVQGHTHIAFLWGTRGHSSSVERYRGYEKALRDYGIRLRKELVLDGDFTFGSGFRNARRMLALGNPPTAIFASNDEMAVGVLAAARANGLNVPYDLSIAGFGDTPFSRCSWPSLTTSRLQTDVIAEHATRRLIGLLRGEAVANEGFRPELVVRGSTAPPRPQSNSRSEGRGPVRRRAIDGGTRAKN